MQSESQRAVAELCGAIDELKGGVEDPIGRVAFDVRVQFYLEHAAELAEKTLYVPVADSIKNENLKRFKQATET